MDTTTLPLPSGSMCVYTSYLPPPHAACGVQRVGHSTHKAARRTTIALAPFAATYGTLNTLSLSNVLSSTGWGIDSMASVHVSGAIASFRSIRACTPFGVEVANGQYVSLTQQGAVEVWVKVAGRIEPIRLIIEDVYYHPSMTNNLLSTGMLRALGWEFHDTTAETYALTPNKERVTLSTKGRLSVMLGVSPPMRVCGIIRAPATYKTAEDLLHLHERTAHMGFKRLLRLCREGKTDGVGRMDVSAAEMQRAKQLIRSCRACVEGRGTRTPFGHRGIDHGTRVGEVLHMDTYYVTFTDADGQRATRYALVMKDSYSEYRWLTAVTKKSAIADDVIAILNNAQTQAGVKVKRVFTDGGTEFINDKVRSYCVQQGIELHYPPAGTQQLNGVAERDVRISKEGVRTLLLHSQVPDMLWHFAAFQHCHVWNRTHIARATGMTPHEAMYGIKPSMLHMVAFGVDVFVHMKKEDRAVTFAPTMEPGVYLGHNFVQNCATVLLLRNNKIVLTRDIDVREGQYTHAHALRHKTVQRVIDRGYRAAAPDDAALHVQYGDDLARDNVDADASLVTAPAQGGMNARARRAAQVPADEHKHDESSSDSDCESLYEVEHILDKRGAGDNVEYLVKWTGYDKSAATWEPSSGLPQESVQHYEVGDLDTESEQDSDVEPVVHMVMSAMLTDIAQEDMHDSMYIQSGIQSESRTCSVAVSALTEHMGASSRHATGTLRCSSEMAMAVQSGVGLIESRTPQTYAQAVATEALRRVWVPSMDVEMSKCKALGTFTEVQRSSLPRGTNVLPVKWVYKTKVNELGIEVENKARLTPKGFRQKQGVDYFEVFASTGKYKTLRVGLEIAASMDMELEQLDVPSAFLHADLQEEVYMEMPDGYKVDGMVFKLHKALYGLKQAPREWYLLISKFIVEELGYAACISDPCLFHKRSAAGRLMLLFLFVDDMQGSFFQEDSVEWRELKHQLTTRFKVKDMGESKWMLGMHITRDRKARTIKLDQELYCKKALEKFGLAQCRSVSTPEVVGLGVDGTDDKDGGGAPTDRTKYMELVGTLLYAAISTRMDIAHAVQKLTQHMQDPKHRHRTAAERVLRYLSGVLSLGLHFGGTTDVSAGFKVSAYADADFANQKGNRKSISGWVVRIGKSAVAWASKMQRVVALSTCEAELYAESAAVQEVLWQRGLLSELGLLCEEPSLVYGDNQSAIAVSKNGVKTERTKHVDIKYAFVTDCIKQNVIALQWVQTSQQQADIFTKALPSPAFVSLRRMLMQE